MERQRKLLNISAAGCGLAAVGLLAISLLSWARWYPALRAREDGLPVMFSAEDYHSLLQLVRCALFWLFPLLAVILAMTATAAWKISRYAPHR
jgi:hypothetical protein